MQRRTVFSLNELSAIDFENEDIAEAAMKIADKYGLSYENGIQELYMKGFENHLRNITKMGMDF